MGGERRRNSGRKKTRQERSDEEVKLRESCYLDVQSCDEMWRWYLGCEKEMSLSCFIAVKG